MCCLTSSWIGLFISWIHAANGFTVNTNKDPEWLTTSVYLEKKSSDNKCTFTIWDPDSVLDSSIIEKGILTDVIRAFFHETNSTQNFHIQSTLSTVVFYVENIRVVNTGDVVLSPMDSLADYVTPLLNLTNKPAFVVFVRTNQFEVLEWFSKPLQKEALNVPRREKGTYADLYGGNRDLKISISVTLDVVTDIVKDMFTRKPIQSSYILFALMGFILISGFLSFGIWVFRFNRSHPTEMLDEENNEMCSVDSAKTPLGGNMTPESDHAIFSKNIFVPLSHEPTKFDAQNSDSVHL